MKKEKKVRTYQRRTKSGKLVTVKQHTAKYDATEAMKEMAKKKGAGGELESKKKSKPVTNDDMGFSQDDFKAWYHWDQENDPKNPAALKVEKALKAKMGAKGYRKYFNDMSDSYSARGHLKAYKECSACGDKGDVKTTQTRVATSKSSKTKAAGAPRYAEGGFDNSKSFKQNFPKELHQYLDTGNFGIKKKYAKDAEVVKAFKKAGFEIEYNGVEDFYEPTRNGLLYKELSPIKAKVSKTKTTPKSSEKKPTKTASKSKRLRRELAEAQAEESRSAVKSATRKSEAAFEKAGVSRKDVSAFMKSSPRKWTYDREEGVYKTMVMPDGKGRARGAYKMSVSAAIKKFQRENSTQGTTTSSDLQSKIDTLKEKAGYRKKGVSFRVNGSSGKYSVMLDGGRTMDKTFKTKREAQEALVGELTKMTEEAKPKRGPRRKTSSPTQSRSSKGPYTEEAKKTKLPAHYVNRYKKEMSKLPESEWEKLF